jgi:DNA-binding transcriptional ArsR family regulator
MSYNIEVGFAPSNELLISFYAFLCKKTQKRLDLGSSWVTETKSFLDSNFVKELERFELSEFWHAIHYLILQCPSKSIHGFLKWFESISAGEMYERLSPLVSTFSINLDEMRNQAHYFLSKWNEQYFHKFDKSIIQHLQKEQESKSNLSYTSEVQFTNEVTNGTSIEPKEGLKKVVLIPQFHYSPFNIIKHFGLSTLCMYSYDAKPTLDGEPSAALYQYVRGISDKSRLKILRFLASRPRTLQELSAYLGLAKSTVHDHVTILRTAGLITCHTVGETATHYSLRHSSLAQRSDQLIQYITCDSNYHEDNGIL